MPGFDLPYQPIRRELYAPAELFKGFDSKIRRLGGKRMTLKSTVISLSKVVAHQPTHTRE